MDQKKVDMYVMTNKDFFPADKILLIKERLLNADDSKYEILSMLELKNPTTMLLISIFLGGLGVDRFMFGETGMGILKLLTGGVFGILSLIDMFNAQKKTKEINFKKVMEIL